MRIEAADLAQLQRNIVLSHAAGVGEPASVATTRLMMALKLGSLAQGASGVQPRTLGLIEAMLARGVTPVVPGQGSVGASGDLAPLAHMAAAMIGVGDARLDGRIAPAAAALAEAGRLGYPLMVKAAAGGGGIGMSVATGPDGLRSAFETARSRAERFFGDPAILLERYVERARHVEIQILGLNDGRVVALGERDCSAQRRHQKVAEEAPSPGMTPGLRDRMQSAAALAGRAVGYRGAGTVECLVDTAAGDFVFLEMNTRLQGEHPVTELVTGIDLVEQQLLIAAGLDVSFDPPAVRYRGHAVELRVYAEDPRRFLPSPGVITGWSEPAGPGIRVDSGYAAGNEVTTFYDPLLAKLCAHGASRAEALARASDAVASFVISGPRTNLPFLAELLASAEFASGDYDTSVIARLRPAPGAQRP